MAKVGGVGGQTIAFVASGNTNQLEQTTFQSQAIWNGNNYACQTVQGSARVYPTSPVDITGMFTEPLVIQ